MVDTNANVTRKYFIAGVVSNIGKTGIPAKIFIIWNKK